EACFDDGGRIGSSFTIGEVSQHGWTPTTPTEVTVVVTSAGQIDVSFGNRKSEGQICIHKFNDLNRNGRQDPGEPGLAGWHFTVTRPDGTSISVVTDKNGDVCFDGGPVGSDVTIVE